MVKNTAECGKRDERELVKALTALGYKARRQPGSGAVDPTLPHDVVWEDSPIGRLLIECKWRTSCGWRTLLKWMEGAPILTLKCSQTGANQHSLAAPETARYVFMKWDTFMALVGSAADRSEIAADLPSVEPNKPWIAESFNGPDPSLRQMSDAMAEVQQQRARIQAAHQNPPEREAKPNKLKGRGFGK